MKKIIIVVIILISLSALILASCVPGSRQEPAKGWAGPAADNGIVYVGTVQGSIVAVNSSTRNLEWSYAITTTAPSSFLSCGQGSTSTTIYSTPVVDGDLVYVASYSGRVLALSSVAREEGLEFPQKRYGEWQWDCPSEGKESNAIVADLVISGDAIFLCSSNGRVYSLDKEFGDLNWESQKLTEKLWTAPAIQGDTVYVTTYDNKIQTLSVNNGDLLSWTYESESGFASQPEIYEDIVLIGSFDKNMYAIKIGDVEPLWSFLGENWFWSAPVAYEGIIYAGCLDNQVYAIEASTGKKLWQFDTGSPVVSSPVLMDNLLIVANESGDVYVFDVSNRLVKTEVVPLKTISIETTVLGPLSVSGNMVYIRAQNNSLYALDIERGGLDWKLPLTVEE